VPPGVHLHRVRDVGPPARTSSLLVPAHPRRCLLPSGSGCGEARRTSWSHDEPAVLSDSSVVSAQRAIWPLPADDGGISSWSDTGITCRVQADANFNTGGGAHLVQLVSGAGGHSIAGVSKTARGQDRVVQRGEPRGCSR